VFRTDDFKERTWVPIGADKQAKSYIASTSDGIPDAFAHSSGGRLSSATQVNFLQTAASPERPAPGFA
jgi:hypothetical protein